MDQYYTEITVVSSKGQIVLPKQIRDHMSLSPGDKLMVMSDGENILLKPIRQPSLSEFRKMLDRAQKWARESNMTETDIQEAISEVRSKRGR